MNDLRVEVHQTLGEIACNFDEIKDALKNQMTAYAELEVTEANIPERKADVATLRKIRTAVEDERKRVKKEFSAPLTEFESRVKEVTSIIDEQINRINAGLDGFEQKRIAEKRAHVKELYDKEIGDLAEYLPFDLIKSPKWDNKTCGDNEIISALQEMKLRVTNDLATIKALNSEIEDKCLAAYKTSGNQLSVAVQKNTEYLEAKKAAEERVRAETERKAREEATNATSAMMAAERLEREAEEAAAPPACHPADSVGTWEEPTEFQTEPTLTVRVKGAENIEALRTYLEMSGMEWEEVE